MVRGGSALRWGVGAELPDDLAENAEPDDGVARGEMQAADKSADALLRVRDAAQVEKAALVESVEQHCGDAFDFGCRREVEFFRRARGFCLADDFVEADGHRLSQIHRNIFFARGNTDQPVAVAEIFVGEAEFFRAEEERDAARAKSLADQANSVLGTPQGMVQLAVADGGGSHDERAIGDGVGDALELLRIRKHGRGADGGARLAKGRLVRLDHAQMAEAEVAHGARGRADVERVARRNQNDAQTVEFSRSQQGRLF